LEKAGVDMINVTGGWHETRVPQLTMALPRGGYAYLAAGIKQAVSIPVMACNRINDPGLADQILRDGLADLIGFARALIADPELPNKAREGRFEEINRCLGCNQGCFDTLFAGQPQTCLVNTRAGAEAKRKVKTSSRRKKVMVIGGGPAGMEAARVAALRGHQVTLYEKRKKLGGQLDLAAIPPGRGEFLIFGDYLETQLKKLNVAIHLGIEVSAVQIEAEKPDALILATGAVALTPPIKGIDGSNVRFAWDVLRGKVDTGKEIVIIGGGAVGLETALFLAHKGALDAETLYFLMFKKAEKFETLQSLLYQGVKKIAVVEMLKKFGQDIGSSTRWTILQDVSRMGIKTFTRTQAKEITPEGVIAERDGKEVLMKGDTVVIAAGARSENRLYEELKGRVAEVYLIGDARNPRKALEAVAEGFEAGNKI
jgi:2,4-dienoyl-CoA reductase (NADPH2)